MALYYNATIGATTSPTVLLSPALADIPCNFPYVAPYCKDTYAKALGYKYGLWRVIFALTGVLGLIFTVPRLRLIYRRGSDNQRAAFPFMILACLSFLARGVDPNSYQDVLPFLISRLGWDVGTASLYSICYSIVMVWGGLIQTFGTTDKRIPLGIRLGGLFLISSTWLVVIICSLLIAKAPTQKFDTRPYIELEFSVFVGLGTIGIAYFLYAGLTLRRRLMQTVTTIETRESTLEKVVINGNVDLDAAGKVKKGDQPDGGGKGVGSSIVRKWRSIPKITKMLVLFTVSTLLVISVQCFTIYEVATGPEDIFAWQIYNLCVMKRQDQPELLCDPVFDNEIFGILQLLTLLLCLWAFWRVPSSASKSAGEGRLSPNKNTRGEVTTLHSIDGNHLLSSSKSQFFSDSPSSTVDDVYIPHEMRISSEAETPDSTPRVAYGAGTASYVPELRQSSQYAALRPDGKGKDSAARPPR